MTTIPAELPQSALRPSGAGSAGDADDRALVEALAFRFGQAFDSYLVVEPDRNYFWSKDRTGVVGYTVRGRYVHVVGGLLTEPKDRPALLSDFVSFVRSRGRTKVLAFYNLLREDLPPFEAAGFQITKCGEEPLVDLTRTTWAGSQYEWLRRQESYCRRQGVTCVEVGPGDGVAAVADELRAVSRAHVEQTPHGQEMGYFVSRFDPDRLARRRVFVARAKDGRIEGFIVCNPCTNGRMWAIETYRRLEDATRGVIPFSMMQAMRKMKAEGVETVSLSLVPSLRAEEGYPGDSKMLRYGQVLWWRYLNWLYDMRGIYHYKSRFRPEFRNMYIAAQPRLTLPSIKSFFDTWGMFDVPGRRLIANIARRRRKSDARRTLANPEQPGGDAGSPAAGHDAPRP